MGQESYEEEIEDENNKTEDENIINTKGFGPSKNSSQESLIIKPEDLESESELSDYHFGDLFEEEEMATQDQVAQLIQNAMGFDLKNPAAVNAMLD
jgi:hypothetical protein